MAAHDGTSSVFPSNFLVHLISYHWMDHCHQAQTPPLSSLDEIGIFGSRNHLPAAPQNDQPWYHGY
jgi:hypothetical protein